MEKQKTDETNIPRINSETSHMSADHNTSDHSTADHSTSGSTLGDISDLKRTSVTDYNQMVQITIFGNSEIDIGQVVELDIPNPDPGDNKSEDTMWAGKYYVIGKRDLYTGDNCSMVLDCAKESMGTEL